MPIAISVNMFRLRVVTDCAPRTKNGHPAQSTTGVASTNCAKLDVVGDGQCAPKCTLISRTVTGTLKARPTQNRRVISTSSGFGALSALTVSGSSAMPQIGQAPGL